MEKCKICSTPTHSVYHYEGCPNKHEGPYIWMKDDERPIEKTDRFLKRHGLEKEGAKGWI